MFEIPKYKVLKSYNLARGACLKCDNHFDISSACMLDKVKSNLLNYSKYEKRLDEKFIKESFDFSDEKNYEEDKLEEIYEAVNNCCEHCGTYHTKKCFLNNTREALQLMLYGNIIPWDGFEFKNN
ncbi:hypothetical protein [Halonatronum saccharophilum]|uniref:hypothetical protein n=1 Tax=Halonatronum saccharophilum TaxID=150060 RepID=UPI000489188C|nr:hypothetical protein [Halonatronum saccharophilum]